MARDFDWGPAKTSNDKLQVFLGWFVFAFFIVVIGVYSGRILYLSDSGQQTNISRQAIIASTPENSQNKVAKPEQKRDTPRQKQIIRRKKAIKTQVERVLFTEKSTAGLSLEFTFKSQYRAQRFSGKIKSLTKPVYLLHDSSHPGQWQVVAGYFNTGKTSDNYTLASSLLKKIEHLKAARSVVKAEIIENDNMSESLAADERSLAEKEQETELVKLASVVNSDFIREQKPQIKEEKVYNQKKYATERGRSDSMADASSFIIQVGAFRQFSLAQSVKRRLEKSGFDVIPFEEVSSPSGSRSRKRSKKGSTVKVQVGPYMVRASVEKELTRIKKMGLKGYILTF